MSPRPSNFQRAETFTVGIAGTLAEVGIYTTSASTTFSGIDILSTSGGTPTLTVLASGTYVSTNINGLAMFDVSLPLPVTGGEVLGLEPFVSSAGNWETRTPGTYVGGQDFFMNQSIFGDQFLSDGNSDGFVTYVNTGGSSSVPEPASFALLGGGLALLLGLRACGETIALKLRPGRCPLLPIGTSWGQRPQTRIPIELFPKAMPLVG